MTTTVFLRFADKAAAISAARAIMAAESVPLSDDAVPLMGYTDDGIRFDLDLVGGDGVYRKVVGTTTIDIEGVGPMVVPIYEELSGFYVNMLWRGNAVDVPDFGSARIYPTSPSQVFAA